MRTYRYICSCICILAALYGLPFPVWGQDNPYKITQNLYLLYEEANRHCYEPLGLQLADSLYRQSIRQGDKKAQCLALTIPVLHYVNKRQFKQVEEAVERIKEVSRKNGYLQYYYFGYSSSINQHINQGRTLLALQESKKMKEQAMADNYPYGIATCLRTMGNIYVTRRSPKEALKCYQEALKYSQKYVTDQDLAYLYRSISKQQHALKRYEEALQAAEQGIACAKIYKKRQHACSRNAKCCMRSTGTKIF
jgi:tetratricopeptide (TPR) repeat protein